MKKWLLSVLITVFDRCFVHMDIWVLSQLDKQMDIFVLHLLTHWLYLKRGFVVGGEIWWSTCGQCFGLDEVVMKVVGAES